MLYTLNAPLDFRSGQRQENGAMERTIDIKESSPDQVPRSLLLEADPSMDRINRYVTDSVCFIATIGHDVIGVCVLKALSRDRYELFNIAVSPGYQKRGIGSQLLRYALEALKERQVNAVELGTGTFGYQLAFYQRFGFRVDSICRDHFIDEYEEPIYENGIQLRDMLRLVLNL